MKKRIIAVLSALTLTFAMGLNVCAAGSVNAEDVKNEIKDIQTEVKVEVESKDGAVEVKVEGTQEVIITVPTDNLAETAVKAQEEQKAAIEKAAPTVVSKEEVKEVVITPVAQADVAKTVVKVAEAVANPAKTDDTVAAVKEVSVLIPPVEINPVETAEGSVTFLIPQSVLLKDSKLNDDEQIWGIDGKTGQVAIGKLDADGNVYFTADSFSPWTFVKVKVEKKAQSNTQSTGSSNSGSSNTATTTTAATDPAAMHQAVWNAWLAAGGTVPVVAIAPKTGDMVVMVSVMAVIFLGGAATAAAMSKKRA